MEGVVKLKKTNVFYKMVLAVVMCLYVALSCSGVAFAENAGVDKSAAVKSLIQSTCKVENGTIRYSNATVKAYLTESVDKDHTTAVDIGNGVRVYYNPNSTDMLYRIANKNAENTKINEKVNDITTDMAVEADTGAASVMLSGFKPILELIIGIIAVLITFGMTLFSALDICYIAFPVFRNKCEDAKQSGNAMMTKKSANGDVSLRWVTDDAQYAVTQGTIDSGKSPWALYFKKRVGSYIFLGIILFILLTGNIAILTNIAVKVVSGIIDILSGLAS